MGAYWFEQYADGAEVLAAFHAARQAAFYEHGHGGYTGSIAEKDEHILVTETIMEPDGAHQLAHELREDPRIADKWGPAGAIPVRRPDRQVTVHDLSGTATGAGELDEQALRHVTEVARQHGLLGDGETVVEGRLVAYQPARRSPARTYRPTRPPAAIGYTQGTAVLTVHKSREALQRQSLPSGWLFFGYASS